MTRSKVIEAKEVEKKERPESVTRPHACRGWERKHRNRVAPELNILK